MRFEQAVTRHGIPLYVFPMPHMQSVATGVLVFAGTRDEVWPSEAGLAHAFEHMLFQGNARLDGSEQITGEIESCGGAINAWTWKEMTFYYHIVPVHEFATGVRSLADQVTTPLFRAKNIESEMQNVIEEIKQTQDDPQALCERTIQSVTFGDHPLARDTLGSIESVSAFGPLDFISWQKRFYYPGNYVLLVVGNVTLEQALEMLNSVSLVESTGARSVRPAVSQIVQDKTVVVIERDVMQANISMAIAVGPSSDRETLALDLYTTMIDGGMSFPLFQEVRNKRGLCYHVSAALTPWTDRGILQIGIGTDAKRIEEAIACIKDVVWQCRANAELFARAKRLLLGSNAINFSNPGAILNRTAMEIVFSGAPKSPDQIADEIKSIDLSEVTSAVERYLGPDNFSYAYVVPKGTNIRI